MINPSLTQEITNLHALNEKPCNVNTLAEELGISQSAASRHLNLLRERGIVTSQREGQSVINVLADPRIIEALDLLRAVLTSKIKNQAALVETDSASNQ
jgi:DNA-binding transcriptional ArsR family regulator